MAMALVIAMQVFFRYGLNESLFWSEELGRMLLVWLTFLGASVAYKRGAHIGADFLVARLPAGPARAVRLAVLAVSLFFFAVTAFYGFEFALFIAGQETTTLGVSRFVPFCMVPLGGCLMFLHGLSFLVREIGGRG
jgi:TRAP-type C4-dicarboxylate transport system permease small subunit